MECLILYCKNKIKIKNSPWNSESHLLNYLSFNRRRNERRMFNIILDQFSVAGNQGKYIFPDVIVDISSAHVMLCDAAIAE